MTGEISAFLNCDTAWKAGIQIGMLIWEFSFSLEEIIPMNYLFFFNLK